jgi:shikimate kinase
MGTGKTTVGRAVAQRIGFKCVDSDHEIERKAGKPITEIFAQEGEAAFRGLERWFVQEGHLGERHVVACGGGLIVEPGMLELLGKRGVIVCLHASIETVLARTERHKATRPLLNVDDAETRARELYAARESIYRSAGTVILTDSRPLNEIASHVVRVWRREAEDFAAARKAGRS